ncbi:MAG: hypothetical protein ABSG93_12010 [Solirubrobacteraceae bacterium]
MFELVKKLSDEVNDLGGIDDDLRQIISGDGVARQVAELLVARSEPRAFDLSVDYSRPLAEVVAAGNYSYTNDSIIEENFPTDKGDLEVPGGVHVTEAVLVHLDRGAESDDVLAELERRGLRPGTMFELAHFGEQHPDIQRQFPVVSLGSVWTNPRGDRIVGYLWGDDARRRLYLAWCDGSWNADCRFLAFRK